MRTTIDIPDETYADLKMRAASEGTSVKALVHTAIDSLLRPPAQARKTKLRKSGWPVIHSENPGTWTPTEDDLYGFLDPS